MQKVNQERNPADLQVKKLKGALRKSRAEAKSNEMDFRNIWQEWQDEIKARKYWEENYTRLKLQIEEERRIKDNAWRAPFFRQLNKHSLALANTMLADDAVLN